MKIAFFGSSLLSSYWNGAATYYRGIVRALHRHGVSVTFYEPDAWERQSHRDIDPPAWARVVVYDATLDAMSVVACEAQAADVIVKASGVGVLDDELLAATLGASGSRALKVYWDVDAAATLSAMAGGGEPTLRALLPRIDAVFTYGGGPRALDAFRRFGARAAFAVYNALDPDTHHSGEPDPAFAADLGFLGNRLPDREARVREFFLKAAEMLPDKHFLLGGAGWQGEHLPSNVRAIGHVPTASHNAFNVTPTAVLNIARDSMAWMGYSPATRVFEAAGAGACIITDAWEGIEAFLEPEKEILVAQNGAEVARHLASLDRERARQIGAAAQARVLCEHTYDRRAAEVLRCLGQLARRRVEVR